MKEIDKKDTTEISGGSMPPEPWRQPPVNPPRIVDGPTFPEIDDPICIPPTFPDRDEIQ